MGINRRTFLKISGLIAAGSVAGGLIPLGTGRAAGSELTGMEGQGMLNDVSKCIGCLSCAIACKKANELPDVLEYSPVTNGDNWTTVKFSKEGAGETRVPVNLKVQCMHCGNPSCVAVCPTGAAFKRDDGIVVIDRETCIGCKYCVMSCPFEVPGLSEETGTVRKCTFCEARVKEGRITACAEACPAGAIQFGSLAELQKKAEGRVADLKSNGFPNAALYGNAELGGLRVLYLLPDTPEVCGLPDNPRQANGDSILKWLTGLAMGGFLVASPIRKMFSDSPMDEHEESGSREGENGNA
ncbi:4Fe-4S dicluster domain-containing protein [Phosphitispora fastidiosa]|uniref:4Fe-4S dicluster domain-containing protein n=1 Tax=Phosphitispora fastidiosa TaxID=2837202 RepID=UPI001E431D73|nr:4Fe-4S dicluster domain-containing protein [Phosphitispora fastidiosa]MBU7006662.1 formate dehydrogenase iron-sulfur subunit [Phosphitispora fastidiosa]